jgi:cobalt-zinc-cadmium efflux system membrane fusion protein
MKNIKNKMSSKYFLLPIAFCLLIFTSCNDKKAEETHEEEKSENEVALTAAQFKTVGVEFGAIENRNLNTVIKANGYTTVPPQNSAKVATLIGGTVKDIFVLEGTFVKPILSICNWNSTVKKH